MDLVVGVYELLGNLPSYEKFALADQIRRVAVSVPANIAEGQKRNSKKEFIQFCSISRGSLGEVETHLEIMSRVHGVDVERLLKECDTIGRMLNGLVKSMKVS